MGAGKSSAGKRLAKALSYSFYDLDTMIENDTGSSVNTIFSELGEEKFREIEKNQLLKTGSMINSVIACGGGTPCFFDNMEYMNKTGTTVYLEMSPAQLQSRISGTNRPLIANLSGDELLEYITKTLDGRKEFYQLAKIIVNGFDLNIQELRSLLPGVK